MRALCWSLASNGMISWKDGPFLELFTLDVLLCTSGTRWTSPTSLTDHVWASRTKKLRDTFNSWPELCCFFQLIVLPSDSVHPRCPQFYLLCRTLYYRLFLSLLQPQCGLLTQSCSDCNLSVQTCWFHWTHHVTLMMLQSVQFLKIIICNSSNARIGLPIGANN